MTNGKIQTRSLLKIALILIFLMSCNSSKGEDSISENDYGASNPKKENIWVFMMAGQSNMAGRATIEAQDSIENNRILTITNNNEIVVAKEPLHFYEPSGAGLDCGIAFGTEMLKNVPENVSILLIPTAVGGSSISQWINDDEHRGVQLFSNFRERLQVGLRNGILKGILWHQGEADGNNGETTEAYLGNMTILFSKFRTVTGNDHLPIVVGKLGSFAVETKQVNWDKINQSIEAYGISDEFCEIAETSDLDHMGDQVHFDSEAQRTLGKRYAEAILKLID